MQSKNIQSVINDIKFNLDYYAIRDKVINSWQDDNHITMYNVHSLNNKYFGNKEVEGYIDEDGTIIIGTLEDIFTEILEHYLTKDIVNILQEYNITLELVN